MFWEHHVLSEASRFHLKLSPRDQFPPFGTPQGLITPRHSHLLLIRI